MKLPIPLDPDEAFIMTKELTFHPMSESAATQVQWLQKHCPNATRFQLSGCQKHFPLGQRSQFPTAMLAGLSIHSRFTYLSK